MWRPILLVIGVALALLGEWLLLALLLRSQIADIAVLGTLSGVCGATGLSIAVRR